MSGTDVESMAIKRCRRGRYVVATEKSLSSTSDFIVGAVGSIWPDAQTPYSACPARSIGYNNCKCPAMVAGATPSGKSQIKGDQTRGEVKWQKGNITDLKGKVVSLRFKLHKARSYSYWLE